MFFNPGNVSNSVVDIISIISPLLSDATFDITSNKIIFTKKNGETFELDLSSLKGLTREEINSMIINLIASTVETISFDNVYVMILGNKEIAGNLILAPLAGYSDRAFRKVCRKNGAAIAANQVGILMLRPSQPDLQLI